MLLPTHAIVMSSCDDGYVVRPKIATGKSVFLERNDEKIITCLNYKPVRLITPAKILARGDHG
jgi:hypothetical protein